MILDVVVPQLSESVAEATLVSWHKKAGEAVTRDENLIDIETDKVVLELPAPDGGVLVEIIKGDGETVVAGEDNCWVGVRELEPCIRRGSSTRNGAIPDQNSPAC